MNKQERINNLTEQLCELQLPSMVSSLELIFSTGKFDSLDTLTLLEELIGPEHKKRQR